VTDTLSKRLCGCGTCGEAIDTAFKAIEAEMRGGDCYIWHTTVHLLTTFLRQEMLAQKSRQSVEEGFPEELLQMACDKQFEDIFAAAEAIEHANATNIMDRLDALFKEVSIPGSIDVTKLKKVTEK
jgi:hypothetical protein